MRLFANREEAGKELANALAFLKSESPIVVAVSNGALPLAVAICDRLDAQLDMLVTARLLAPRHPEHIVGAVDEHGRISLIEQTARWHHLTTQQMIGPAREAFRVLERRRSRIRAILPEQEVRGKCIIVVDDGVTDGAAMLAAIVSLKDRGARKVIAAAPAGQQKAIWTLHETANMVVIPHVPANFRGIDKFYKDFPEIDDTNALEIIRRHLKEHNIAPAEITTVAIGYLTDGGRTIYCEADLPSTPRPHPVVVFAHGFESDCRSPRNVPISRRLAKRGVMSVRLDFQGHGRSEGSRDDCSHGNMVEDLRTVIDNLRYDERCDADQIGLCGSGTGGLVALEYASGAPEVGALVARGPICGGVTDAASSVAAPTLLIHAESDQSLRQDIERINELLPATHRLLRIPECNRLFNDPISRELMVSATVDWLVDHLKVAGAKAAMRAENEDSKAGATTTTTTTPSTTTQ